jgi:hypothetical protein
MGLDRIHTYDARKARRHITRPRARHGLRRFQIGSILLRQAGCVGLALFVTAGFALGLSLYAGRSALDPGPSAACAWFFAWCVILLGSTSNA